MTAPRFLLVGLGSELSLRPLAFELSARGLPVGLVDLAVTPASRSSVPEGDGRVVLVTSQHLAMTGGVYDKHMSLKSHYMGPQAIKANISADLLVYVPHDLAEPILPEEIPLLSLLDLYAAPDDTSWWTRAYVHTVVTGWVGTASPERLPLPSAVAECGVFLPSQVRLLMLNGGSGFFLKTYERVLEHGVAVKLPAWPGVDELANGLARQGVSLIDPAITSSAVARQACLVVSNAASSVLAEAALLGHRPVCVLAPAIDGPHNRGLSCTDLVVCTDDEFPEAHKLGGRVREPGPAFNVEIFIQAIDELLGRQLHQSI